MFKPSIWLFLHLFFILLSLSPTFCPSSRHSPPPSDRASLLLLLQRPSHGCSISLSICLIPHVPAVVPIPSRLQASHLAAWPVLNLIRPPAIKHHLFALGKFFSGVITERILCLLGFWSCVLKRCIAPRGTNQIWVRASKYQNRSLIIIFFAYCQAS